MPACCRPSLFWFLNHPRPREDWTGLNICRRPFFCVYCVTVDTLVIVWLNFGVCMYVYEDSNFGNFLLPYVYAYAHIWLKHQACEATITKVANT